MEETTQYPLSYYPHDEDDSYFFNKINYNNVIFTKKTYPTNTTFSSINFSSTTGSHIMTPHNERFNFNTYEDFSISLYATPAATGSDGDISATEKRYIIAKSGTKTSNHNSGSLTEVRSGPQYPFEIYMVSQSLYFSRSDGKRTDSINCHITASASTVKTKTAHIVCQLSSSIMEIWFNGVKRASTSNTLIGPTKNNANLYIGSKGPFNTKADNTLLVNRAQFYNGELSNINIWSRSYNAATILNISESVNASPYIGNIFYQSGIATITHPNYTDKKSSPGNKDAAPISGSKELSGGINTLQFQGSHLIYEHEYQCSIQDHEFNSTKNISARDQLGTNPHELANFTTSSYFQPYITTVGLYDKDNNLLVVGKLGQPVKKSDKANMTFVLRWDT